MSDDLWWAMPVLAGRLIRLEPLTLEQAPGYLAAAGTGEEGAEVFRWLSPPGGAGRGTRFDGSWRDTVQYAMVDDDWPAAKAALTARLGLAP